MLDDNSDDDAAFQSWLPPRPLTQHRVPRPIDRGKEEKKDYSAPKNSRFNPSSRAKSTTTPPNFSTSAAETGALPSRTTMRACMPAAVAASTSIRGSDH
ncbi:hypothetical protein DRE_03002 [Drechslerella stenobrocha 248]|uniref:Uncharacterized protein n=1 Tax=Drechslerella stenobrocha 248 TaxID=1043628 RepID=W7I5R0_9PEZI|nr:hypothetical protein DRE_03002 [Drechslerella stenobrocha 248]